MSECLVSYGINANDDAILVMCFLHGARQSAYSTACPSTCDESVDLPRRRSLRGRRCCLHRIDNFRARRILMRERVVLLHIKAFQYSVPQYNRKGHAHSGTGQELCRQESPVGALVPLLRSLRNSATRGRYGTRRALPICDSGESQAASVGVRTTSAPRARKAASFSCRGTRLLRHEIGTEKRDTYEGHLVRHRNDH